MIINKNITIGTLVVLLLTSVYLNVRDASFLKINQQKGLETNLLGNEDLFQRKQECQKYEDQIEKKLTSQNFANPKTGLQSYNYLDKIFYSPKSNSCLYIATEHDLVHGIPSFETPVLVDVLTGEKLVSGLREVGEPDYYDRIRQFELIVKDYE